MAKGDFNVNREGPRTKGPGGRRPINSFALFGTDEEIEQRGDDLAMVPGAADPGKNPTAFRQTAGEVATGKSVNRAPLQFRNGNGGYNEGGGPGRP